jgi:hypothetical protein
MTLVSAACLVCYAATVLAADATGTWKWTVKGRDGQEVEITMDLKQEGDKLTGKITLPFGGGFEVDVKDGTVKNDEVNFKTEIERDGNTFTTKYTGKVEGDTIKGKTERERNGEVQSRDWEAKRAKK